MINPFSDNLILKRELIEKLHEADMNAAQMKQIKMTPEQFQAFVNRIFAEAYKEEKLYPYTEEDYSVMALEIAEDLTLIRVDLLRFVSCLEWCF